MGPEPLKRSTPFVSSVYEKIVGYRAVRATSLHKTQLNLSNFRVVFITAKNSLRAKNIVETSQEGGDVRMFLAGMLQDIEDPLTYLFTTGRNEKTTLLL
jgi:hypothetical protein